MEGQSQSVSVSLSQSQFQVQARHESMHYGRSREAAATLLISFGVAIGSYVASCHACWHGTASLVTWARFQADLCTASPVSALLRCPRSHQ